MSRIFRRRPSPSMIVAGAALVVALAGTAIAGPLATKSVLSKSEKKQVKNIAKNQVTSLASGLSVANATNANNAGTVDGANASDLKTSSAFNQNPTIINSLGGSPVTVASATITTQSAGRILASGSAELFGSNTQAVCEILIDGNGSPLYESDPDDVGTDSQDIIAVNFAVTRPAGTYTASLRCYAVTGTVGKDDAAINVYGLGA